MKKIYKDHINIHNSNDNKIKFIIRLEKMEKIRLKYIINNTYFQI